MPVIALHLNLRVAGAFQHAARMVWLCAGDKRHGKKQGGKFGGVCHGQSFMIQWLRQNGASSR